MGDVRVEFQYGGENGENASVKVIDSKTREPIVGIRKMSWELEAGKLSEAVLHLQHVPVFHYRLCSGREAEADADVVALPLRNPPPSPSNSAGEGISGHVRRDPGVLPEV